MSRKYVYLLIIAPIIVVLDQVTKYLTVHYLPYRVEVPLIEGRLNLFYILNKGAAFSLFAGSDAGYRVPLLFGVSLVALAVLVYLFRQARDEQRLLLAGLSLITGGAVGNAIDRLRLGAVVDFIDVALPFEILPHWPAFNLADIGISVGIFMMLVQLVGDMDDGGREEGKKPPGLEKTPP